MRALEADSRRHGTQGDAIDFALLVDGLAAEREQGITIDVAYRYFDTDARKFIVADCPGHEQYTRNMATGASTADVAVVLVDARKGVLAQTRRHSYIVSLLGIRHVLLAVNKMDLVGYDKAVFDAIVASYGDLAAQLGIAHVQAVPLSALQGDNMTSASAATPWYPGPSLLGWLETVEVAPPPNQAGFRLPVQWVNRPHQDFRGFAGTVAAGVVAVGDEVVVLPSGRRSTVARIVTADGDLAHLGAEHRVDAGKAGEGEDGFLDAEPGGVRVGQRQRVGERQGAVGADALRIGGAGGEGGEGLSGHQTGGDGGDGTIGGLGDEGHGAGGAGVHFQDVDRAVLDGELDVHQADDVEGQCHLDGLAFQFLDRLGGQLVRRQAAGRVAGVDTGLFDMFHDSSDMDRFTVA